MGHQHFRKPPISRMELCVTKVNLRQLLICEKFCYIAPNLQK